MPSPKKKAAPSVTAPWPGARLSAAHRDLLRRLLVGVAETLSRRRADLIDPSHIEDYVALDWLAWQGGSLKLTTVGENICRQLRLQLQEAG